jgi:hypothetical protein
MVEQPRHEFKFATGVVDTSGNFAAGVVDTGDAP